MTRGSPSLSGSTTPKSVAQVKRASPDEGADATFLGGVKNYDEDTLLLLTNKNSTGEGHVYLWRWRADAWERCSEQILF